MQYLSNILAFLTFFMIPFLGGNHLPLYYISVDKFWIEEAFGVALILSLLAQYLNGLQKTDSFSRFCLYFLPLLGMTAVSLFYSWNKFSTIVSISVLVWTAGAVYLYSLCPNRHTCLIGLISGASVSAICAILQHLILFPHLTTAFQQGLYAQILKEQQGIPFSSYSYHNILGGYLAFVFPLGVYFAVYKRSILSIMASGLIIIGVVLTSTRIGLGIMLLTTIVSIGLVLMHRNQWQVLRILAILILGVGFSLLLLHGGEKGADVGVRQVIAEKAKTVHTQLSTINTRTDIWKNALTAFRYQPLMGYGAGAFEYAYRRYFDGNSYTGVAHSILIKTAVELGIVGVICLFFYFLGVAMGIRQRIKEPLYQFILLSVLAGIVFGLVDFSFDVASHVITFFVLSSAFFIRAQTDPHLSKAGSASFAHSSVFAVTAVLMIASLLFGQRVNVFKASLENGDRMTDHGFSMNALGSYREAIDAMPLSSEGYIKAINVLASMYEADTNKNQRTAMAKELTEYTQAMERSTDRDSELSLTMGKAHALLGNKERARNYFSRALFHYPSSGYYIYEIASYFAAKGDIDAALAYVRSFDPYIDKYKGPNNPRGIFVYKIRDLEADLVYKNGNENEALKIARKNFQDARNNVYVITSARSRNFVARNQFVEYLRQKADMYGMKMVN